MESQYITTLLEFLDHHIDNFGVSGNFFELQYILLSNYPSVISNNHFQNLLNFTFDIVENYDPISDIPEFAYLIVENQISTCKQNRKINIYNIFENSDYSQYTYKFFIFLFLRHEFPIQNLEDLSVVSIYKNDKSIAAKQQASILMILFFKNNQSKIEQFIKDSKDELIEILLAISEIDGVSKNQLIEIFKNSATLNEFYLSNIGEFPEEEEENTN